MLRRHSGLSKKNGDHIHQELCATGWHIDPSFTHLFVLQLCSATGLFFRWMVRYLEHQGIVAHNAGACQSVWGPVVSQQLSWEMIATRKATLWPMVSTENCLKFTATYTSAPIPTIHSSSLKPFGFSTKSPQYSSTFFERFSKEHEFLHIRSSTYAKAESKVQTKALWERAR